MANGTLKPGIYRHYKGKDYKVHGTARHSETLEELVVYETLYHNDLGKLWVRPLTMFTGQVEVHGQQVPRFAYMGDAATTHN